MNQLNDTMNKSLNKITDQFTGNEDSVESDSENYRRRCLNHLQSFTEIIVDALRKEFICQAKSDQNDEFSLFAIHLNSLVRDFDYFHQKAGRLEMDLDILRHQFEIIAKNTTDWEFWLNPMGRFYYCSPVCQKITGYTAAEFKQDSRLFESIIHPADRNLYNQHRQNASTLFAEDNLEIRIIRKDGKVRWITHSCRSVFNEFGNFIGYRGSNRDITRQKNYEHDLEKKNRNINNKLDIMADKSSAILIWNDQGQRPLQYISVNIGNLIEDEGKQTVSSICKLNDLVYPDDLNTLNEEISSLIASGTANHLCNPHRICAAGGKAIWVDHCITIQDDPAGRNSDFISYLRKKQK
ncbi:MAG: PAS domain-containing protein [candidate division Zixibacteria bacterium]|nr:PAS domain-containing protein [candidate division Zixibacteria bacterium]